MTNEKIILNAIYSAFTPAQLSDLAKAMYSEEQISAASANVKAARFAGLDGVRPIIKGARTSAPVVWLSGETEKHADAIRAAGAKWSGKRNAYYIRVA